MSNSEYAGMGLFPEELAALEAPFDENTTATQEELEAQAAADAGAVAAEAAKEKDDADSADTSQGGTDDDTAPAAATDNTEPAAAASAPAPAEPAAAQSPAPQQAPILVAQAPADAAAKLKEISDGKADLRKKYDDGELTFAEFQERNEAFDEQRLEIRLAVETANTAQKMEAQRQQNQWNADCAAFMDQHKELYDGEANAAAFADLDAAIKVIAVMPSNVNKTGQQILDMAHRAVMASRGTPVVAAKNEPKPAPRKEIPKAALPPDLGKMPAATGNDPGEGKWGSLDRLLDTGAEAYEAALAKLSDAERDAYLAS